MNTNLLLVLVLYHVLCKHPICDRPLSCIERSCLVVLTPSSKDNDYIHSESCSFPVLELFRTAYSIQMLMGSCLCIYQHSTRFWENILFLSKLPNTYVPTQIVSLSSWLILENFFFKVLTSRFLPIHVHVLSDFYFKFF